MPQDDSRVTPCLEITPSGDGFIIAFVNCGSGGRQGADLAVLLKEYLGDDKGLVVDLSCPQTYPHTNKAGLRFPFSALEGVAASGLTVLSCGGDGTHSWVWGALVAFYGDEVATNGMSVVPVPLGSGNDLSNALGWGQSLCLSDLNQFMARVGEGKPQSMDRWSVGFETEQSRGHNTGKSFQWQNYLSLGFDATVSYEFENCRQCCWSCCFSSICVNQCWYCMVGAPKICDCCFSVNDVATIYTRDSPDAAWDPLDVPSGTQAVVLCNIASYGAGMNLWEPLNQPGSRPELLNDGKVELLAVSGPCNFVCGRGGCCGFHKLAQAAEVQIELTKTVCLQADGEGWVEAVEAGGVTRIEVSRHGVINTRQSAELVEATRQSAELVEDNDTVQRSPL